MLKGLFFDLDGTLLFTEKANFYAYRDALADFNLNLTLDLFCSTAGKDSRDFLKFLFPDLSHANISEVRKKKAKIYLELFDLVEVNKPMVEILRANQDKLTAVVTNAKSHSAYTILKHFALSELVDEVFAGDLVKLGKPDSSIYLKALEACKLKPSEVVAFEDSDDGMNAAHGAGILAIRAPKTSH